MVLVMSSQVKRACVVQSGYVGGRVCLYGDGCSIRKGWGYVDVMGYSNGCGGPLGEVGHSVWGWRGAGDRSRQRVEGSGGVCSVGTLHDACTRKEP